MKTPKIGLEESKGRSGANVTSPVSMFNKMTWRL